MIHQLKIESPYFEQIRTGVKTFEIRRNDREFHVGDYLGLNEITKHPCNAEGENRETGNFILVKVLSVFDNPYFLKDGFVIMGIKPCNITENPTNYANVYRECLEDGAE